MSPRTRLTRLTRRQTLASLAVAPFAFARNSWTTAPTARPNIVFIMADDLGFADLSCYGRPDYRTPNLDHLATEGIRFTQAYANSAVCTATRVALITGRYQYRLPVGLEEPLASPARNIGLPPSHPTLPSLLRKSGSSAGCPTTARSRAAMTTSSASAAASSTTSPTSPARLRPIPPTCGTATPRLTSTAT
jgi:Sulfatase